MRLSDYKGEKALDVLADMLEPASEILADVQIAKVLKDGEAPLKAVMIALKSHKRAVIEMMAALEGTPVAEYEKTINLLTLPKQLLELINDPELKSLFTLRGQMNGNASSGSAMENTEEKET